MIAGMSAAPQKKTKTKSSKVTSHQRITASTVHHDVRHEDRLNESWTDRPDSLKILVECAALLGIADKLNNEGSIYYADELATRAAKLINACEFSLKLEVKQAEVRVGDQLNKLQDMESYRIHLSFNAGAKALLKLGDDRPSRLDKSIRRLLKLDFESEPRSPRSLHEYGSLNVLLESGKTQAAKMEYFIKEELAWYRAKGFAPEDLKRLSAFSIEESAEEE